MKNRMPKPSTSQAAVAVGVAFILSAIIVTIVDDLLLANFVIPGDTDALAIDISGKSRLFGFALVGYLIVLLLDVIIGLALYVVLASANKTLALITSALRLLYAFIVIIALFALAFKVIDVYNYASLKVIAYIFFALHILVLGYSILKCGYIPKSLGMVLILAAFTYMVFFIDIDLPEILLTLVMLTMAIAELSLSIWLIVKRNVFPKNIPDQQIG